MLLGIKTNLLRLMDVDKLEVIGAMLELNVLNFPRPKHTHEGGD